MDRIQYILGQCVEVLIQVLLQHEQQQLVHCQRACRLHGGPTCPELLEQWPIDQSILLFDLLAYEHVLVQLLHRPSTRLLQRLTIDAEAAYHEPHDDVYVAHSALLVRRGEQAQCNDGVLLQQTRGVLAPWLDAPTEQLLHLRQHLLHRFLRVVIPQQPRELLEGHL